MPLVACDPYFSIWSPADKLTDADTVHWTGKPHRLTSLVRIDGKAFRVMGTEPAEVPRCRKPSLEVLPTRTIYTFEGAGVGLTLTFMTPALPDDLDVLSRPVTYLTCEFRVHGREAARRGIVLRRVRRIGGERTRARKSRGPRRRSANLWLLKVGSKEQPSGEERRRYPDRLGLLCMSRRPARSRRSSGLPKATRCRQVLSGNGAGSAHRCQTAAAGTARVAGRGTSFSSRQSVSPSLSPAG